MSPRSRSLVSFRTTKSLGWPFCRSYAAQAGQAVSHQLNVPIDFGKTGLLHHNRQSLTSQTQIPSSGPSSRLNLCQSINSALRTAMAASSRVLCFGEDVAFGGVFRCTTGLQEEFVILISFYTVMYRLPRSSHAVLVAGATFRSFARPPLAHVRHFQAGGALSFIKPYMLADIGEGLSRQIRTR